MSGDLGTWTKTTLSNLGDISGGGTPSTQVAAYWEGGIPWLVPNEVTKNRSLFITRTERTITAAGLASSAAKLLPAGTVMMTSRATIGLVTINNVPMATNQGFINVVCNLCVVANEFLAFWMQQHRSVFEERANGVTFKEISKANFRTIPISLPPLAEQRAIAHALRTVQAAGEARRREIALERERKAALLHHLFTRGTRNEPTHDTDLGPLPKSWRVVSLNAITSQSPQNGAFVRKPQFGSGIPFVNVADIYRSVLVDLSSVQRLPDDKDAFRGFLLNQDDLLFVRSSLKREGVGQCCLIGEIRERAIFDCHLIRIVLNKRETVSLYIANYFLSERGRRDLIARSKTTTMTTINQKGLLDAPIPLPALDEQRAIADILGACDVKIASLEREAALHDELFRAMLEELMSGRLSALPLAAEGAA